MPARTSSAATPRRQGRAIETLFRPSDIAVGPDGALYVSDWIDPRVGGHQDLDETLSGAIYRIAPKGFISKVPTFDAGDDRRADHGAAIAGGQRARDRLRRAEGARRGGGERRSRRCSRIRAPTCAAAPSSCCISSARRAEARRRARVVTGSGDAHRRLPRDAARRARRPAGGGAARARHRCRRPPRSRAVDARSAGRRGARHPRRHRARLRRPGSQLPRSAGHRRDRQGSRRSTIGCGRSSASSRCAGLVAGVRADRVAAARAGGGAGPDRARAVGEAVARRPHGSRWTRSRSSNDPAASKAMLALRGADEPDARDGDVVAAEPHVRRLGRATACGRRSRRPASTIPTRSTLQEIVVPPPRGRSAGAVGRRDRSSSRATPRAARRRSTRCLMCHTIGGTGAELGPALDGWGRGKSAEVDRHRDRQAQRRDRVRLRRHRAQDQGRPDDPGRADQAGRSADDAQHGRRHADHSRRPRRRTRRRMTASLMMSAAQLGLTAQDVADLVAFLRSN